MHARLRSSPYPPYEVLLDRCEEAAQRTPGGTVTRIGETVEGRALVRVDLPPLREPPAPSPVPRVLLVAGIHGIEVFGPTLALRFLEREAVAPSVRRRAAVTVVPVVNADGYVRTLSANHRLPLAALRTNARGVDLNRNFPIPPTGRRSPWPGAGSLRPGAATYRGPHPLSEPETRAVADLAERLRPAAALSLHTFMGTLLPAYTPFREDHAVYAHLCAAFAAAQTKRRYRRVGSRRLDGFTGELEDFLHHRCGTFSMCVESWPIVESLRTAGLTRDPVRRFNPEDPRPWIENDLPGLQAFFAAALDRIAAGASPRRVP